MKASDHIASFLKERGVKHVFGLQGGAVVHLFDSAHKIGLKPIYCHHEQAAGLAAVAYSRVTENYGAAIVTTGPGAMNSLTGLLAAWQDSIPCMFISGQTRAAHTSYGKRVRQVGSQEFPIIDVVRPMTKRVYFVSKVQELEQDLLRAYHVSIEGRPGPVWLDIPFDVQNAQIELKGLEKKEIPIYPRIFDDVEMLLKGRLKPLVVAGNGIRLAKESKRFLEFIEATGLPFVTTWTGADLAPTDHPLNVGILGVSGQQGANRAVHEADFLLVLGSHLSLTQTSTLVGEFSPESKRVFVNIDPQQMDNLNVRADFRIESHLTAFFDWAERWEVLQGSNWAEGYRTDPPDAPSYNFNREMTKSLPEGSIMVVDGGGTALYTGFQSSFVKKGSRIVCSSAISAMGSGLPEAVGSSLARPDAIVTCLIGDGSLMLNLQELSTIRHHNLPIKIMVLNNGGYLAIRQTQNGFLGGRYHGTDTTDLTFPNVLKIAQAFDIQWEPEWQYALKVPGPTITEIKTPRDQKMLRQAFKDGKPQPLSEMTFA